MVNEIQLDSSPQKKWGQQARNLAGVAKQMRGRADAPLTALATGSRAGIKTDIDLCNSCSDTDINKKLDPAPQT
ncbi:hypothetical protein V6N11_003028 [Hibiscus sabdariffa]|uniref:Uncharacterized protein n=1 Tax=Hibiscus sabdariffa TaxID=183260 RepID=A0ABR2SC38_9ROSI